MRPSYSSAPGLVRRYWYVFAFVLAMLFPFEWLAQLWPPFETATGILAATAREHTIGHLSLFSMLGILLLTVFPALRTRPWRFGAIVLLVAVGQEVFQLAFKQRGLVYDDIQDLAIDAAGTVIAWIVVRGILSGRRGNLPAQDDPQASRRSSST